jgi:hypothetical protein
MWPGEIQLTEPTAYTTRRGAAKGYGLEPLIESAHRRFGRRLYLRHLPKLLNRIFWNTVDGKRVEIPVRT